MRTSTSIRESQKAIHTAIHTMVVAPRISFADIEHILGTLGWQRRVDPYAPEPMLPGEPEFAGWARDDRGETLVYGFNPAISLRVLALHPVSQEPQDSILLQTTVCGVEPSSPRSGPAGRLINDLYRELPVLQEDDIRALLASEQIESIVLGIYAARELSAIPLLGEVSRLTAHTDATVAQAARECAEQLLGAATTVGADWITRERREHPGQSILFKYAGDARTKRQVLRWFIHDRSGGDEAVAEVGNAERSVDRSVTPGDNVAIVEALYTALQDEDWEVQVTAMLAIGRLRVAQLRSAVDKLHLPSTGTTGLSRADCHLLSAARAVVITSLNGDLIESKIEKTLTRMPGVPMHFARCVLGLPFDRWDAACLFITSLTTPVPEVPDIPDTLPQGIVRSANSLRLKTTDIEMVWVPPLPHWLGGEDDKGDVPNPIRQIVPEHGYFIAKRPLTVSQVHAFTKNWSGSSAFGVALESYEMASQWCDLLSRQSGASVSLPTADMWEMAARGPDGRRYPWGNNLDRASFMRDTSRIRTVASPWGVQETVGVVAQWALHGVDATPVLCGVPKTLRVSARTAVHDDSEHAVRPVVLVR